MYRRIDWSKYVPAGFGWKEEFKWIGTAHGVCAGFSLLFLWQYVQAYSDLFYYDGEMIEGARMPLFTELYGGCMAGFLILAVSMLLLAGLHYASHFMGTKSIYLMRRLPDRWDLVRRVWTIPVLTIIACAVFAALLTIIYLAVYYLVTPAECLVPGQF